MRVCIICSADLKDGVIHRCPEKLIKRLEAANKAAFTRDELDRPPARRSKEERLYAGLRMMECRE